MVVWAESMMRRGSTVRDVRGAQLGRGAGTVAGKPSLRSADLCHSLRHTRNEFVIRDKRTSLKTSENIQPRINGRLISTHVTDFKRCK
jgi:hypothetical protein